MKRLALVAALVVVGGGCAGQQTRTASAPQQPLRLGAGDELGWQLRSGDRAISQVSAEERELGTGE